MSLRMYVAQFNGVSISAAQDIFNISSTASRAFALYEFYIGSDSASVAAELRVLLKRMTATVTAGSGGSSVTPAPLSSTTPAAVVTARVNDTTRATTSGTTTVLFPMGWNVLNGFWFTPQPEFRPVFGPNETCLIGLESAPGSATTCNGYAVFEEIY